MTAAASDREVVITTPEGVALGLRLADLGDRAMAFIADVLIVAATLVGLMLVGQWSARVLPGSGFWLALSVVLVFLVQSFYFVVFELRWQGSTPGKRWRKLRVVSRDGGPLTVAMVFVRNVTRQVELTIPLVIMFQPRALTPDAPEWVALPAVLWAVVLVFFPALNRQRARLGDLAAGTLVVSEPVVELEADLAGSGQEEEEITFRRAQLEVYGNKELRVLEDILRREPTEQVEELLRTVAGKVQRKIGWEPPDGMNGPLSPRRFLVAFYAAQRRRLEHEMVLGRPQEEKVDGNGG